MGYEARVIADSMSPWGVRLTTMVVTFPRFILAEFNTHRMLSRNSASSRAIPVHTLMERIQRDPFLPIHWGKNRPGMQATDELDGSGRLEAEAAWLGAMDSSLGYVRQLLDLGLHKQAANRLLEPFMWQTVVVTATEWANFFALRVSAEAQPEIREAAELMLAAYHESSPRPVADDEWHLPFIQRDERDGEFQFTPDARKISAARCARVSYLTHDGQRDHTADLALYERLVTNGHMSPLEHVATPFTESEMFIRGAMADQAEQLGTEPGFNQDMIRQLVTSTQFCGNFRGWIQLRKTIKSEEDFSLMREE